MLRISDTDLEINCISTQHFPEAHFGVCLQTIIDGFTRNKPRHPSCGKAGAIISRDMNPSLASVQFHWLADGKAVLSTVMSGNKEEG